jgi:outer membrane biosynthesis protein TonB
MTTTTATEFILGHSTDDSAERKKEARQIFWALLAALAIHLVIGYSIAISSGLFSSPMQVEQDKPVELTFVDLATPAPAAPKNSMFVETDESKQSADQPNEKTFESNANSIGASELAAAGGLPLPTQEGKDRPTMDLETHQYSLANEGAQPQPSARPQETPSPSVAPTPVATPISEADQFAMLTSTPMPSVQPTVATKLQPPKSSYQPMKEQTRLSGAINNRGAPRVNAIGTPLGRYQKLLYDAVGSRWYSYVNGDNGLISIGTARLMFSVDREGRVKNLKVLQNSSNEAFANVCLRSVLEIQLPPIPEDVASTLPPDGLEEEMTFTMFAN